MVKKILIFCLLLILFSTITYGNCKFKDLENSWAKEEIMYLVDRNIVTGYNSNLFKPKNQITVAEFLKLLVESKNINVEKNNDGYWYQPYVDYLFQEKMINHQTFDDYNKPIKKIEAGILIAKILNLEIDQYEEFKKHFYDWKYLKREKNKYLGSLFYNNIFIGDEKKYFNPNDALTREQASKIIYNILNRKNNTTKKLLNPITNERLKKAMEQKIIDKKYKDLSVTNNYDIYHDNMTEMINDLYKINLSFENPTDYFFIKHNEAIDGPLPGVSFAISNSNQYFIKGNYNYLIKFYKHPINLNRIWLTNDLSENAHIKIKIRRLNTLEKLRESFLLDTELNDFNYFYTKKIEESLKYILDDQQGMDSSRYILKSFKQNREQKLDRYSSIEIGNKRIDRINNGFLIFYISFLGEGN